MEVTSQKIVIDINSKIKQEAWIHRGEINTRVIDFNIIQNGRPFDITDWTINA